jgi:hypothetical protein
MFVRACFPTSALETKNLQEQPMCGESSFSLHFARNFACGSRLVIKSQIKPKMKDLDQRF